MKMNVPFFDLKPQSLSLKEEIQSAIDEVFETQQFILGAQVEAIEQAIAQYCQTTYAIGVASGSDALFLSLMALGIGPGDEVILPPSPSLPRQVRSPALKPFQSLWISIPRPITSTL